MFIINKLSIIAAITLTQASMLGGEAKAKTNKPNIGKIPMTQSETPWTMEANDRFKLTNEEYDTACEALDFFIRGFIRRLDREKLYQFIGGNQGERTMGIYITDARLPTTDLLIALQHFLGIERWIGWRILIKTEWTGTDNITIYSDIIFCNAQRMTTEELIRHISRKKP